MSRKVTNFCIVLSVNVITINQKTNCAAVKKSNFAPTPKINIPIMSLKKQKLYEAAAQLFREKGYVAASMRDLADRLQLQVSSLYNHINSKEDILKTICFEYAQTFLDGIKTIEAQQEKATQKIRNIIGLHISITLKNPVTFSVFNDEWRHLSEPLYADFLVLRRDYEERFRNIIKQGIAAGELRHFDPNVALYTLLASVRWLHYWYKPARGISPQMLEKQIEDLLLFGITTQPS